MQNRRFHRFFALLLSFTIAVPAFAWGDAGHRLVARIAARNLNAAARGRIAAIIRGATVDDLKLKPMIGASGTPSPAQIEKVLFTIAIWPDHILPNGKQETEPWHFVDIGLFEGPSHISQRCPGGACVSQKITDMIQNIKAGKSISRPAPPKQPPVFTPDLELRFLVHFLGDIHQPLHCATDADAGGNCIHTKNLGPQLHHVWDTSLVDSIIAAGTSDTAGDLITKFTPRKAEFQAQLDPVKIAAESFDLARTEVYAKPLPPIPVIDHFVDVRPSTCATQAPAEINQIQLDANGTYNKPATLDVIRQQLYKGGVRLAAILNGM